MLGTIFVTQKQCVRALNNKRPWDTCKPLFRQLSLLTVACMYIFEICVLVKSNPDP